VSARACNGIVEATVTHYCDNGQTVAYVHWTDRSVTMGDVTNTHMAALIARARREHVPVHEFVSSPFGRCSICADGAA
jgi:hypothetical protein